MSQNTLEIEIEDKRTLCVPKGDIDARRIDNAPQHHLLYQLPTGGGKTVVFSEIVRRYLSQHDKKSSFNTPIELCKQTSKMLKGFDVKNKIINSKVKNFRQNDYLFCCHGRNLENQINDEKYI
jgi:hypothetical protein